MWCWLVCWILLSTALAWPKHFLSFLLVFLFIEIVLFLVILVPTWTWSNCTLWRTCCHCQLLPGIYSSLQVTVQPGQPVQPNINHDPKNYEPSEIIFVPNHWNKKVHLLFAMISKVFANQTSVAAIETSHFCCDQGWEVVFKVSMRSNSSHLQARNSHLNCEVGNSVNKN